MRLGTILEKLGWKLRQLESATVAGDVHPALTPLLSMSLFPLTRALPHAGIDCAEALMVLSSIRLEASLSVYSLILTEEAV